MPMLATAVAFTFLLRKYEGTPLATHAVIREMLKDQAAELDTFANACIRFGDVDTTLKNCIEALPDQVKESVCLDIQASSFRT
jgi:3-hydroxyisobutyrate dehydrogenase